jgi:hypothetical protein
MLLPNGSMIKNDVIESFNTAVVKHENVRADGSIEWNFVDADMHMDLSGIYSSEYIGECMEVLADEFTESRYQYWT